MQWFGKIFWRRHWIFKVARAKFWPLFFALSIISDFFLYVTSLEIMSNCVLYSYKLHSSSRTLLQDDDFFFAKKSVVGKTLFPNFTSILSCSIIFAWAKFTIGFTTHSVVAAPKTLCSVVVILRSSVPSQLVIPSEKKNLHDFAHW